MKTMSGRMKVLLMAAACAVFLVPALASAQTISVNQLDWTSQKIYKGETVIALGGGTRCDQLQLIIQNGEPNGKNRMSSVKVSLLGLDGEVKEVLITPDKFNQAVPGYESATFSTEGLYMGSFMGPKFLVQVNGKPTGYVTVTINGINKNVYVAPPPKPSWMP